MHLNLKLLASGGPGSSWEDRENPKQWRAGGARYAAAALASGVQPLFSVPRWESQVEAPKTEASGSGWKGDWREAGSSCPGGYWRTNLCGRDFGLGFTSGWLATSPRRGGGQTLRPRGGPWPSEQGCRARLAQARVTGKLFETPQEAQASHPPPLSAIHLVNRVLACVCSMMPGAPGLQRRRVRVFTHIGSSVVTQAASPSIGPSHCPLAVATAREDACSGDTKGYNILTRQGCGKGQRPRDRSRPVVPSPSAGRSAARSPPPARRPASGGGGRGDHDSYPEGLCRGCGSRFWSVS